MGRDSIRKINKATALLIRRDWEEIERYLSQSRFNWMVRQVKKMIYRKPQNVIGLGYFKTGKPKKYGQKERK